MYSTPRFTSSDYPNFSNENVNFTSNFFISASCLAKWNLLSRITCKSIFFLRKSTFQKRFFGMCKTLSQIACRNDFPKKLFMCDMALTLTLNINLTQVKSFENGNLISLLYYRIFNIALSF